MSSRPHVKYLLFLSDFNKTFIFSGRSVEKSSSGSRVVPCRHMMKLTVAFHNFANVSKSYTHNMY